MKLLSVLLIFKAGKYQIEFLLGISSIFLSRCAISCSRFAWKYREITTVNVDANTVAEPTIIATETSESSDERALYSKVRALYKSHMMPHTHTITTSVLRTCIIFSFLVSNI